MSTTATAPATAETTATAGAEVTFHVTPVNLERALRIAVLAASTDTTLPVLNTVALTLTGAGNLVAVATDRYKLVRAAVMPTTGRDGELPQDVAGLSRPALIRAADVKTLTAWLKPQVKALGSWGTLAVTIDGRGDTTADPGRLTINTPEGGRYTVNLTEGEYPAVQRLLADWAPGETTGLFALNPAYLEVIAKMGKLGCERNTPMTVRTGATAGKPVQFRGGSGDGLVFEGLLMPVRLPATDGDAAAGL